MVGTPSTSLILKHLHTIVRVVHCVLLLLVSLGSLILFIVSICQRHFPNAGADLKSTEQDHYSNNNENTPCGSDNFPRVPLRYRFENDTTSDDRWEYCGWNASMTGWRAINTIIVAILTAMMIDRLRRRSPASDSAGIWQKPKRVLKALLLVALGCTGSYIILMMADGVAMGRSQRWCSDKAKEMDSLGTPIICDYTPFLVTIMVEMLLTLLLGLVSIMIVVRWKCFINYMQLDDEDEQIDELELRARASTRKNKKRSKK